MNNYNVNKEMTGGTAVFVGLFIVASLFLKPITAGGVYIKMKVIYILKL
ncbi:hypothetical protein HHL23_14565 [Chryseobacterium sp. RP-3-3]|uniref:Uncharacterized protein n=1 Tax=Chryseobacterium antibioticum TaxID=2728847 RepID=A0A7Y0FSP8_9FLAO|nr:hypothetical protein [Chryseobacterium antibioticum]NML71010.1 hypothetical protein [Chryseobacterium antibioticum]